MTVIEHDSSLFREAFIDSFVNQQSAFYIDRILFPLRTQECECYRGFLWECLKSYEIVSINFIKHFLLQRDNAILAMCDLHPMDYFPADWSYPRDVVFSFEANETEHMISILPEDCYFFDKSLTWAFALTHEELKPGKRSCIFVKLDH